MRINLFGGPGAGKSTTCAFVFSRLKKAGLSVEQVAEYVKAWAYQKRDVQAFDQIYLLGKQMQYEYRFISKNVKYIVTDSPVFLSYVYAKKYFADKGIAGPMLDIIKAYENGHPSLNIFLDRGNKPYDPDGRWQDEQQAREIDELIKQELDGAGIPYYVFDYENEQGIVNFILDRIKLR